MNAKLIEQLATRLISFGIASVKISVKTETVSISFAYNNLRIELEIGRDVIDEGIKDIRKLAEKIYEEIKDLLDGDEKAK